MSLCLKTKEKSLNSQNRNLFIFLRCKRSLNAKIEIFHFRIVRKLNLKIENYLSSRWKENSNRKIATFYF